MINFATSDPVNNAKKLQGGKQKGGRWTDRVKDKRRQEGAVRKQTRGDAPSAAAKPAAVTGSPGGAVLGKRSRGDEDGKEGKRKEGEAPAVKAKGSITIGGGGGAAGVATGGMIQPRRGPLSKNPGARDAPGGEASPVSKTIIGPGGKKQYISSLFTAEGLPVPSAQASAPIIPSRPSNAPLRAAEPDLDDTPVASTSTSVPEAPKPSPAPALTALGLMPELVNHLAGKMNITGPTACQAGAIPPLLAGTLPLSPSDSIQQRARDAILQAQTGSGKTLAFLLPLLQDLLTLDLSIFGSTPPTRAVGTLALILAPTRELAAQIYAVLESVLSLPSSSSAFTVPPRALTPCLLVGGANRTHEKSRLRKGCPIVVATPGRLLDHLRTTESFRIAGEPIKNKGPRGRGSLPGTGANYGALGRDRNGGGRPLGLRWLVVDECDRLMDLGFEEQMKGVLEELERRSPSAGITVEEGKRRTVLCSATASEGVDRLAGMALQDPVTLSASTASGMVVPAPKSTILGEELDPTALAAEEKISFTPPTQLVHNYIVCPPKLRFVGLVALLRRLLVSSAVKKGPGNKILIFLSCTAAVDFYWEALGAMGMGSAAAAVVPATNKVEGAKEKSEREKREAEEKRTKLASLSTLLPGVPIYRLHGNLELETRLGSLKAFSRKSEAKAGKNKGQETENAVLLCTSVAARGLDVPFVSHVVQYDLPTEVSCSRSFFSLACRQELTIGPSSFQGGVTEYIHRVGRTARAGASGQATSFLLPSETEWVPWVETGMRDGAEKREAKDVKLREVGVEDVLKDGFGGEGREYETRATDVQMGFERWVSEDEEVSFWASLLLSILLRNGLLILPSVDCRSISSTPPLRATPSPPTSAPTRLTPRPRNPCSTRNRCISVTSRNPLACAKLPERTTPAGPRGARSRNPSGASRSLDRSDDRCRRASRRIARLRDCRRGVVVGQEEEDLRRAGGIMRRGR